MIFRYRDCSLYIYKDGFPNTEFPYLVCLHYDKNHSKDLVYVKLCYNAEIRRTGLNKQHVHSCYRAYVHVTMIRYLNAARNAGG
jgi:hypothetical protein